MKTVSNFPLSKDFIVKKPTLVRNLKDWRWELRGKKIAIVNKKAGTEEVLDKVRLMSFIKFAPNCLDRMRIEETKILRAKIRSIKQAHKEKELRAKVKKAFKAELIKAKASIKRDIKK